MVIHSTLLPNVATLARAWTELETSVADGQMAAQPNGQTKAEPTPYAPPPGDDSYVLLRAG